jgi:hypothetical protein
MDSEGGSAAKALVKTLPDKTARDEIMRIKKRKRLPISSP